MFYQQLHDEINTTDEDQIEILGRIFNRLDIDAEQLCNEIRNCHWMTVPFGRKGNELFVRDVGLMPHLLVAGTTGSGKSTFVTSLIAWLHLLGAPENSLFLIDPKCVEFSMFAKSAPVAGIIEEVSDAYYWLTELTDNMDKRFKMMRDLGVREYRECGLPPVIVIVDEWADLFLQNKKIQEPVIRLAQKGRAAGIHLILATQRPTRDVVTGLIKANFPARVCFGVASQIDSRVVLDEGGAEELRDVGQAIFSRGRDKVTFSAMRWDDDSIRDVVKLANVRQKKIDERNAE